MVLVGVSEINNFITWLNKQQPHYKYTAICSTPGQHKHAGVEQCHDIDTHHRFEHRGVMSDTEIDEFTDPKITQQEMKTSEDDPGGVLTDISIAPIARAHGVDSSSLLRELKIHFPKISDQIVEEERFTQEGQLIPYKAIKLTRHQVQWAHDLAQDIYRRKTHRSGPVRTMTKEFLEWVNSNG